MKPIAVIGNVNVDLILGPAAPWPQPGTEIIVDHDELRVGGCAGNSALALKALGVPFALAASIGSDRFGAWLAEEFGDQSDRWRVHAENTTISVGITHPDGERTFFTTLGHLPHYGAADVLATLDGEIHRDGYALFAGPFLMPRLANEYDQLYDWADRFGIRVALDTGWPPAGWTPEVIAAAKGWLARSTIALFNEVETTSITGRDDVRDAARAMLDLMPKGAIAVVKRGPHGALAASDAGLVEVAAPKIKVIDTIGAGDVFNAGFLAALAAGKSLEESLAAGTATASLAVSTYPRRYASPESRS